MGIGKPVGSYANQMLEPDAWPEVDEDNFFDRAQEWTQVLRQVTDVLDASRRQRMEVFGGGGWSGGAATAANGELRANIHELVALQHGLATVITWQRYVAGSIVAAKSDISDIVDSAHQRIEVITQDSRLEAAARTAAIDAVVTAARSKNAGVVAGTAEQILASKSWTPPNNALDELLDQKVPPPVTLPDGPQQSLTPPTGYEPPPSFEAQPPTTSPPVPESAAVNPTEETPDISVPSMQEEQPRQEPEGGPQPTPTDPEQTEPERKPDGGKLPWGPITTPTPAAPSTPPAQQTGPLRSRDRSDQGRRPARTNLSNPPDPTPGGDLSGPSLPSSPAASSPAVLPAGLTGSGLPSGSAGSMQPPGAAGPRNDMASVPSADNLSSNQLRSGANPPSPTTASGAPVAPLAGGGSGAGGGARSGGGSAPVEKPSAKAGSSAKAVSPTRPATARPAGTPRTPDRESTGARHETLPAPAEDVAAAIPVSEARAERDAIADAATPDAARRQGTDPVKLARRVAAALNAPGNSRPLDLGFFWITAVTTEGKIVVANSYGLAYVPDGLQLPDEVHLASADPKIPVSERARWATYPVIAVQDWAAHHDHQLRVVIGTEKQLSNSDSGAAKIVLEPDDIPAHGDMPGRDRLKVVDPSAAERLAATTDAQLMARLPPAPVPVEPAAEKSEAPEDTEPEEPREVPKEPARFARRMNRPVESPPESATADDQRDDPRTSLWFAVSKPLASKHPSRQARHLSAFRTYAACAQELLLTEAHNATDPTAQRAAVADWLYWKYQAKLLDSALSETS